MSRTVKIIIPRWCNRPEQVLGLVIADEKFIQFPHVLSFFSGCKGKFLLLNPFNNVQIIIPKSEIATLDERVLFLRYHLGEFGMQPIKINFELAHLNQKGHNIKR